MGSELGDLVESPYDDAPRRNRGWTVVAIGCLLAAGLGALWWSSRGSEREAASTTTTSSATTTVARIADVELVPFVTDPQILTLPTLAPDGFEVCSSDRDVVLCNADDLSVTITPLDGPLPPTVPTGITGLRWIEGDLNAVVIAIGNTGIVYTGDGFDNDNALLLDMVASVPIASNASIIIPDEPPLSAPPERTLIAELLDIPVEQVEGRGAGNWGVNTADFTFGSADLAGYTGGEAEIRAGMRLAASQLERPVSISGDRSLIVGYRPGASEWAAQWAQRGKVWFLYATATSVPSSAAFVELVLDVEQAIADLP